MWLPSFLTFPLSFGSLPSVSLPANIQRRFLSYVLKRSLGRFVVASGFDVERIQAQLSQGSVELEKLEVNVEEINCLIPDSLPFNVTAGEVAKVSARVPFPNLWSDPLSLTIDSLTLEVAIVSKPKAGKPPSASLYSSSQPLDLASSVTSAAGDFVHDELDAFEGAQLDRSIRESFILAQSDPFSSDDMPGAFAPYGDTGSPSAVESTTVLATLVERILARLQCRINNVRLRLRFEDEEHGGVLELRIAGIRYADETPELSSPMKTVRAISLSTVEVYMLPISAAYTPSSPRTTIGSSSTVLSRMSSSSSSDFSDHHDSESSGDEFHSMVMSQAVADLRESVMIPPQASTRILRPVFASQKLQASSMSSMSGKSVYHSFMEEDESDIRASQVSERQHLADSLSSLSDPFEQPEAPTPVARPSSSHSSRGTPSPTPTAVPSEPTETLLLSFGSEDIVWRMVTSQAAPTKRDWAQHDPASPASMPRLIETPPLPIPTVDVSVTCGTLTVLLRPEHTALLLAMTQSVTGRSTSPSPSSPPPSHEPSSQNPDFIARLSVKAVYVTMVYDLNTITSDVEAHVMQYFARPPSVYPPIGHLRLRLEQISSCYTVPGSRERRQPRRRGSTPKSPSIELSISDVSLFEYLASASSGDDEPPGGTFPVLLFDVNLPKQYEVPPGAPSSLLSTRPRTPASLPNFPEFDSVDWRNPGVQKKSGEKAWRVRPKNKGIMRERAMSTPDQISPAISVSKKIDTDDPVQVDFLPVHVFLDLSLVERLLPLLRMAVPPKKTTDPASAAATPKAAQLSLTHRTPHRSSGGHRSGQPSGPVAFAAVRCPLIRLDIRCPAPLTRRGSWGDGAHLRSGIVTLDIHDLNVIVAEDGPSAASSRRPDQVPLGSPGKGGINVEWQKVVFLFSRAPGKLPPSKADKPEKRSSAFLVIGPLAPEPGDDGVLLPTVSIRSEVTATLEKVQSVTCSIPSVQAKIRQSTVEGLQFFADDMTHWLDGAFGDGSAPKPRDDLKMIGSRFFGSKASSSASSSDDYEEDDDARATLFRVAISEAEVAFLVPKANQTAERILSLRASDLDMKVDSNTTEKQETTISITAMDADLFHYESLGAEASRLFGRTTPLTLTTHTQPLISLRFSSLTNPDRTKETGIRLATTACTVFVTKELDWVKDLKLYAKTPEGVFEDVVPSEVTRIQVLLNDCSLHVATPNLPGALLIVSNVAEVRTTMENHADESSVDIGLAGVHILAIDDLTTATKLPMGYTQSLDAWKRSGYVSLVELVAFDAQVVRSSMPQHSTLLDVIHSNLRVTACADSFATLGALAGDVTRLVPSAPEPEQPRRRTMTLDQSVDVFGSVDLDAFNQAPEMASGVDMIDDDLPTNLDYLDHAAGPKPSAIDKQTGESLRSWETPDESHEVSSGRDTIRILDPEPFEEDEDYWNNLPEQQQEVETRVGKTRVRLRNSTVSVMLHEGYDWPRTRKAIEDEIKKMRRRLERIKQLLASGQKADESIDNTSSVLFNSVYIGFEQREDMDNSQLLAAIDEELEDLNRAETETQSSWQTFPQPGGVPREHAAAKSRIRLRGKRLTRSKKPQIEFKLDGLQADIDVYGPEDETAAFVHVTAKSFEILDHIKTSTWKKFLTEMKADSRGNVRETDANMVRLELVTVRPDLPSTDEEIRLRVKILPLRLHVDQDALDFLKHYFSFTPPGAEMPVETGPKVEPFFQHVEIFPVELKLDYKPKRVDYGALRRGRTIELMNFFHFEGAEMTLRHVTLSGVTGSTRLSDMLQDIWTPDVKANQLAEVISGVSPIRSVVNVGSGVADLILLPIEQYRKDGRVARGVQRGTNSFVRSTALEMMKLGARLATGTQVVLEQAEGILGSKADSVILETVRSENSDDEEEAISRYANQPTDVREGVKAAYQSLSSNFNSAAQTILAVPMEVYERSGDDGPLKAVVRAVPIAVLKPMIGASEAVSKTLWGLRNSLDPEGRREMGDKYK